MHHGMVQGCDVHRICIGCVQLQSCACFGRGVQSCRILRPLTVYVQTVRISLICSNMSGFVCLNVVFEFGVDVWIDVGFIKTKY